MTPSDSRRLPAGYGVIAATRDGRSLFDRKDTT